MNIRKIAKKANCSVATVSRVLSGKTSEISISESTRTRILDICREFDYTPSIHATRLFSKASKTIGFLCGGTSEVYIENRAISLFYVTDALAHRGYRLLPIVNNQIFKENDEFVCIFKRGEIDGLIVWGATPEQHDYLKALNKLSFPTISLANQMPGFSSVYSEQRTIISALTKACIERGARRIVGIMPEDGYCYHERREGFISAASNYLSGVIGSSNLDTSDPISMQAACDAAVRLNPDAIVCANDDCAAYLEMFLLAKGKQIPDDIMITGGDNLKIAEFCPVALTTFDQMTEQCAREAVRIMLDHLENKTSLLSMEIPSKLIWRDSLPRYFCR